MDLGTTPERSSHLPRFGGRMPRTARLVLWSGIALGLLIGSAPDSAAQTGLLRHNGLVRNLAGVVYQKPFFDGDPQISSFSGTYEFFGGTRLINNLDFTCSLAVPVFSDPSDTLDNSPANVTIGLRKVVHDWIGDSRWWFVNLTAGTYRNHAGSSGPLARLTNVHEYQKYVPTAWCLAGGYALLSATSYSGWVYGAAVQPILVFDGFSADDRHDLVLDYQFDLGWSTEVVQLLLELHGSAGLSSRLEPTDTRFAHTAAVGVEMHWDWLRPGIYYNLPLTTELAAELDGTLVVQVFVTFAD
jgi:hypothetical protein